MVIWWVLLSGTFLTYLSFATFWLLPTCVVIKCSCFSQISSLFFLGRWLRQMIIICLLFAIIWCKVVLWAGTLTESGRWLSCQISRLVQRDALFFNRLEQTLIRRVAYCGMMLWLRHVSWVGVFPDISVYHHLLHLLRGQLLLLYSHCCCIKRWLIPALATVISLLLAVVYMLLLLL